MKSPQVVSRRPPAKSKVAVRSGLGATDRAVLAARAADSKNSSETLVLDLSALEAFTDAFVITSATSARQAEAIAEEVERVLADADGSRPRVIEGLRDISWILMDYGDIVVHIFLVETRAYYELERLWSDGVSVTWQAGLAPATT